MCALSGLIATPTCPRQVEEWVGEEGASESCDWHRATSRGVVVQWPVAYQLWAASQHLLNITVAMPSPAVRPPSPRSMAASTSRAAPAASAVRVLSPPDGAVYLLDPTLRREFQTVASAVRRTLSRLSNGVWMTHPSARPRPTVRSTGR